MVVEARLRRHAVDSPLGQVTKKLVVYAQDGDVVAIGSD